MVSLLESYARLLVDYCLEIKPGDRLYVSSTTLAAPLVREVYRTALQRGALVETSLSFQEQDRLLLTESPDEQLKVPSPFSKMVMEEFEAYLHIRAPFNLREDQSVPAAKRALRNEANKPINKAYFERTATRALKRNLCQYPTQAAAQEAGMSLEEYTHFVFKACKLFDEDPIESWLKVRRDQQAVTDYLNQSSQIRYRGESTDITFSTKGRTWINSDGQTNMPSGEVYTSPVEDSVKGVVHFNYPAIYMGQEVEGVTLWVNDGYIEKWEAKRGKAFLDEIFQMKGTRRFGEAAIGTNYDINRFTKNILFDEKIGGTVHMAIGQSYLQTGGKNTSSVHWDMIADMTNGGAIYADDKLIYENGQFLLN